MRAITLRNIPAAIQRAIEKRAAQKQISVNKAVLEMLQERVGILEGRKKTQHHDLDDLAGTWSAREAKAFEKRVELARRTEPSLWE
jgi:plasmid stability protein